MAENPLAAAVPRSFARVAAARCRLLLLVTSAGIIRNVSITVAARWFSLPSYASGSSMRGSLYNPRLGQQRKRLILAGDGPP